MVEPDRLLPHRLILHRQGLLVIGGYSGREAGPEHFVCVSLLDKYRYREVVCANAFG